MRNSSRFMMTLLTAVHAARFGRSAPSVGGAEGFGGHLGREADVGAIFGEGLREQGFERLEFAGVGFAREAERVGELQARLVGGAASLRRRRARGLGWFRRRRGR
jgi:hypothetical protein